MATWAETLGSKNWSNISEPLDLNLLKLILRSGDFCQATYDSFNNDKNSKYCGSCRYGKTNFFDKVMLEDASNYEIAAFLYATALVSMPEAFLLHSMSAESWDRESNWFGYIAVTNDPYSQTIGRREIYVVFRGTTRNYEWIDVAGAEQVSAAKLLNVQNPKAKLPDVKVMRGWFSIYTSQNNESRFTKLSLREQLLKKIADLRTKYQGENVSIVFCGHSLGASVAILGSLDVVENGVRDIPVAAIVFGSPGVGNKVFNERYNSYPNLKALHVRNTIDLIPLYPGTLLGYGRTGVELIIDTRKSPYLKDSKNSGDWHNLQAMLHVVAGWNGKNGEFKLRVKRSVALVNKSCDFLKDELMIPGSWWIERNKGLIRDENGEWIPSPPEELPTPEF